MKKFIETVDGIITKIVNVPDDKADRYSSSMTEVSVDVDVKLGYTDNGDGTFSKVYTNEELAVEVRTQRDALLEEADILHAIAYDTWVLDNEDDGIALVANYRKALRDIPQNEGFPQSVVWPTKPGGTE